ncbi:4-hydroxy-tetrahydrodipicolinate reductase [Idiomarina xiamenensis]|uniref:4-hydroxy-tetrahydrodipicolinate reductase n=1 Tax=Idiomarina xiamenensis 10-D-4 TaxID=740709 RepID=K2L1S0_9GAMM|nr:4-hydroxy-tetrahydrodipicolinate reductase [Idiomarina xiamenensis]EKE83790.1 dihydrodipicolinate reductase [Idiomarina xiamenensis 10-D-4]
MQLAILGASGRMGQALSRAAAARDIDVIGIVREQSTALAEQQHVVAVNQVDWSHCDVIVDFSSVQALSDNLALAQRQQLPIVVCTTGLSDTDQRLLDAAAKKVPVLYAANTSVGVNLLQQLVRISSQVLAEADIEIVEAHHKRKLDAPSGTALLLGEAAAAGRGQRLADVSAGIRGAGERQTGSIGFACLRAGDIVGEHSAYFVDDNERIEITHRVANRQVFADGALRAAAWLMKQAPGRYKMSDMLGIEAALAELLKTSD